MRKLFFACFFSLMFLSVFSCGNHLFEIPEDDFVEALQEALFLGSQTAALNLGDSSCESLTECTTGYLGNKLVEIAVPDTVEQVLSKIDSLTLKLKSTGFLSVINNLNKNQNIPGVSNLGISNLASEYASFLNLDKYVDSLKTALNRGAEKAAPKSVDAFKGAIFSMSILDAKSILLDKDAAATNFLKTNTYSNLQTAFAPIIKEPLDLLKPNNYWKPIASNYNKFTASYSKFQSNFASFVSNANSNPAAKFALNTALKDSPNFASSMPKLPYESLSEDLSGTLSEYATGKALDGLFTMVGKKETELRDNPWGTVKAAGSLVSDTVGDLLGDVFSKAKEGTL